MKACACGMPIHPDHTECESCEYSECPSCGGKQWRVTEFGTEAPRKGFCDGCVEAGLVDDVIANSEAFVANLGWPSS
jgi:hypothetical protein